MDSLNQLLDGNGEGIFAVSPSDTVYSGALVASTHQNVTVPSATQSSGTVQLSAGASGSVDSVLVDGKELLAASVAFDTDLNTTAAALSAAINQGPMAQIYEASVSTDTVTIKQRKAGVPKGEEARNGSAISTTTTTLTAVDTNFANGVDAPDVVSIVATDDIYARFDGGNATIPSGNISLTASPVELNPGPRRISAGGTISLISAGTPVVTIAMWKK